MITTNTANKSSTRILCLDEIPREQTPPLNQALREKLENHMLDIRNIDSIVSVSDRLPQHIL